MADHFRHSDDIHYFVKDKRTGILIRLKSSKLFTSLYIYFLFIYLFAFDFTSLLRIASPSTRIHRFHRLFCYHLFQMYHQVLHQMEWLMRVTWEHRLVNLLVRPTAAHTQHQYLVGFIQRQVIFVSNYMRPHCFITTLIPTIALKISASWPVQYNHICLAVFFYCFSFSFSVLAFRSG